MFTLDHDITVTKIREKNLVKLYFSMNNHQVATPEMTIEEARSYVMFCEEAGGRASAFIGIYLLLTGRRLFYAHSSNPFPADETGSVEDEALCFVDGLGALVDQIDVAGLSDEEKDRWLEGHDIFSLHPRHEKVDEAPSPHPEEESSGVDSQPSQPVSVVQEAGPQLQQQAEHDDPCVDEPGAHQPQPAIEMEPEPGRLVQPLSETHPQADPALPAEEVPAPRETEKSTPEPSPSQPAVEPVQEPEHEGGGPLVPASADVCDSGNTMPEARQTPNGEPDRKEPEPAGERMHPMHATGAAGARVAPDPATPVEKKDFVRETLKAGFVAPPKASVKRGGDDDADVVRRDREALARLLTSF